MAPVDQGHAPQNAPVDQGIRRVDKMASTTEAKPEKKTARELQRACGDAVFDNPMLMALIRSAPSANAADKHLQRLGWGTKLAQRVRNGARLRLAYPTHFESLAETSVRPATALFGNTRETILENDFCSLSAAEEFVFGTESAPRSGWPLFLRELRCQHQNYTEPADSFDCHGSQEKLWREVDNADDESVFQFNGVSISLPHARFDSLQIHISAKPSFNNPVTVIRPRDASDLQILAQTVMIKPDPTGIQLHKFPRFYKVLQVSNNAWQTREVIRIMIRMEESPISCAGIRDGKVVYIRTAEICERFSLRLTIPFYPQKDWTIRPNPYHRHHITTIANMEPPHRDNRNDEGFHPNLFSNPNMHEQFAYLCCLAHNIIGKREPVSLLSIAGLPLFENQPKSLDLLLRWTKEDGLE